MAALLPTDYFASYDFDADTGLITIDIDDLPGLTAAEANATTGRGEEVARCIIDRLQQTYATKAVAGTAPTKFVASKATPIGVSPTEVSQTYSFTVNYTIAPSTVVIPNEPA